MKLTEEEIYKKACEYVRGIEFPQNQTKGKMRRCFKAGFKYAQHLTDPPRPEEGGKMTVERIKEIQDKTAYPESISVQQALFQVWHECVARPETAEAEKKTKSEQFIFDFMYAFDENGLAADEKTMYLRAYSVLEELRVQRANTLTQPTPNGAEGAGIMSAKEWLEKEGIYNACIRIDEYHRPDLYASDIMDEFASAQVEAERAKVIKEGEGRIERLEESHEYRIDCRHYLMSVEPKDLTVEKALDALGFGHDGLRY